ncbi:ABC transporter periplasmic spermidine putrescine-binding protein PotD [Paramagnetospirillum magnetotacticum MS-1]|uniref:ABC transporter periplasmic spermidine putrescine-binding protein PotD n=2 Tax=Paramagnetospirillum magnetotacticum TaxID=188 RepID=A0A0C2U793_PARME|nr:ABC transporter periplasmic spermidine putrescine-binding protein PotD [Paramagnetospirillum magnetotacticum MS-1]
MRRLLVLLAVLLLAGVDTAASELRVLTRSSYLSPELLRKFERETGITVNLTVVADHDQVVGGLIGAKSGFDIAFSPDYRVGQLIREGLIERVLADRLNGFWNVEDPWRSRSFDPRNEYTIPHQWGTTAFAVDTSIHRGDIDSLRLLFDPPPEIEGRIGLLDDGEMVQLALIYLGEGRCTMDEGKLEKASRLLEPVVAHSRLVPVDRVMTVLTDPAMVLVVGWNGDVMRAREKRPSLAYAYPREGNLVWTDVVVVPRNPPNRANAVKFLTFMLRPENAALDSSFNGYANMIRGSERFLLPSVLSAPELVAPWPAKVGFLPSCVEAAERRHDEVWTEVKRRAKETATVP